MTAANRLTDAEYEALSVEYMQNPPKLSGKPGFLTVRRENELIIELLSPDYVRIISMKAKAMLLSPSEVIQRAIKEQPVNP